MRKTALINILCFLTIFASANAQDISYILPDIGAPGMNIYIEFIGPFDAQGNFGDDGFYLNNPGDDVRIEFVNPADSTKMAFGPLVVSWDGRMISTQAFIYPYVNPNSWDWSLVSNQFKIDIKVSVNGTTANEATFYIVQPFSFGDKSANGERVLGEGSLGKRSPRGAMIVDSMILANDTYTVSMTDPDNTTPGNQAYLPFILLVEGKIEGGANTIIDVSGKDKDGGPGGGGGGGKYCDAGLTSQASGNAGGDGYTGGGPGGSNDSNLPQWENQREDAGNGSGGEGWEDAFTIYGGNSLNGLPGGTSPNFTWEAAGGGTGHPFGLSGEGCNSGSGCDPLGGFGGGSGYQQDKRGGNAGYALDGDGESNTGGKAHGNIMVVPVAGGSGGASGNPQALGGCSGDGGGGGGAINLFGEFISDVRIRAYGGRRITSSNGSGGNGSGGYTGLLTKLGSDGIELSVPGGRDSVASPGRIRYDSPELNTLRTLPMDASQFRGITSDTTYFVYASTRILGSGPSNTTLILYLKPQNGQWGEAFRTRIRTGNSWTWNNVINELGTDSLYCLSVVMEVDDPSTDSYMFEPSYVMSQAAANILYMETFPLIDGDTLLSERTFDCPGSSYLDTAFITNIGTADLIARFDNATFEKGNEGFTLLSPTTLTVVAPGDTQLIYIRHDLQPGQSVYTDDVLLIPHNAFKSEPNPWRIRFEADIDSLRFESWDIDLTRRLGTLDLGRVCIGEAVRAEFAVWNKSSLGVEITLKDPKLRLDDSSSYRAVVSGKRIIPANDTGRISVTFLGGLVPGTYITGVVVSIEECDVPIDTVNIMVDVVSPKLELSNDNIFPDVKLGKAVTQVIELKNTGNNSAWIESIAPLPPPFTIIDIQPPIPPARFLDTGDVIRITIEYRPQNEGQDSTLLKIVAVISDTTCPDSTEIMLYGNALASKIFASTDSIYFGLIPYCGEVQDSVVIKNAGTAQFEILSEEITGPDAANFVIAQFPGSKIVAPQDSALYYIRFIGGPGGGGFKNAQLTILTDDIEVDSIVVQLTGEKEVLDISSVPAFLDFGMVPIGQNPQMQVTLTNNGTLDWHVNSVETTDPNLNVTPQAAPINGNMGTAVFDVTYQFTNTDVLNDTLYFIFDTQCPDTFKLYVTGQGLEGAASVTDPIDYGMLPYCTDKLDSVIVENTGDTPIGLDTMYIQGPDAQLFTFVNKIFPDSLNPGDKLSQIILFSPVSSTDGIKNAQCVTEVTLNGIKEVYYSELTGQRVSAVLNHPDPFDFGTVAQNTTVVHQFTIINNSLIDIILDNIQPLTQPAIFDIDSGPANSAMQVGDPADFSISFTPPGLAVYYDTLKFTVQIGTCIEDRKILIMGQGVPGDSVTVWFPADTLVKPTITDFRLPIFIQRDYPGDSIANMTYNASVSFDATMFYPDGMSQGTITNSYINSGRRYIEFTHDNAVIKTARGILTEITGQTMLGETDVTDVRWESIEWVTPGKIGVTTTKDGVMRTEICEKGGERFLKHWGQLTLMVSPHPVSDKIKVDLTYNEVGHHILELIDVNGRTKILKEWISSLGDVKGQSIEYDTGTLSSGVYYLRLRTPTRNKMKAVYIVK